MKSRILVATIALTAAVAAVPAAASDVTADRTWTPPASQTTAHRAEGAAHPSSETRSGGGEKAPPTCCPTDGETHHAVH